LAAQALCAKKARHIAGAAREYADAPVAVARVLSRQGFHRVDHGRILHGQAKLAAQA
jgi:hypothetical protein